MMFRAICLIAFAVLGLNGFVRADNAPKFSSRKPSVVIPLLANLSHKDDSREVVTQALEKILGKPDSDDKGSREREYLEYQLDDKTKITVVFENGQFVMIMAPIPSDPDRVFYTKPN